MTNASNETIQNLRQEVEALKAEKVEELNARAEQRKQEEEVHRLEAELADLKAGRLPSTATDTSVSESAEYKRLELESARVRLWAYGLGAYLTGPIFPFIVANRTKNWAPFWIGLAAGTLSLPFAFLDLGIISSLPATGIAVAAQASKTGEKRRKLGILMPEQADARLMKSLEG